MVHLVCTSWVMGAQIADALAEYEWRRKSAKHDERYEREEPSLNRAPFSAMNKIKKCGISERAVFFEGSFADGNQQ